MMRIRLDVQVNGMSAQTGRDIHESELTKAYLPRELWGIHLQDMAAELFPHAQLLALGNHSARTE